MWPGLALQLWALTFNPLNFNNNLEHLHLLLQRPVTFVIMIILIVWRRLGGVFSRVWWMPTTRFPAAAAARADTPTVISLTLRCLQWTAELTPPPAHHQPNQLWLGRRWSWAISREANGQSQPVTWPTWVRPALCPGELQVNKWCHLCAFYIIVYLFFLWAPQPEGSQPVGVFGFNIWVNVQPIISGRSRVPTLSSTPLSWPNLDLSFLFSNTFLCISHWLNQLGKQNSCIRDSLGSRWDPK